MYNNVRVEGMGGNLTWWGGVGGNEWMVLFVFGNICTIHHTLCYIGFLSVDTL